MEALQSRNDLVELVDQFFAGDADFSDLDRLVARRAGLYELQPGLVFVAGRTTSAIFATPDGLLVFDTGGLALKDLDDTTGVPLMFDRLRAWSDAPIHTVVISQLGADKLRGLPPILAESEAAGSRPPDVVVNESLVSNAGTRQLVAGYDRGVNGRQFQGSPWHSSTNTPMPEPTLTYRDSHVVELGGEQFHMRHGKGETDDQTWLWVPDRRVVCCGDSFACAAPNAGNPQRVVRYPREWAVACREMAALKPVMLLPGHWLPMVGEDRVQQVLTDTADYLERIHDETVRLMNEGADLERVITALADERFRSTKPYLRPAYDEPEFIARNIWRLYGGWYDLDPAHLKPAPRKALATTLAELSGGATVLARKASELALSGTDAGLRLASHLIEFAVAAAPDNDEVHAARIDIYDRRARAEASGVARGIFATAANESRAPPGSGPGRRRPRRVVGWVRPAADGSGRGMRRPAEPTVHRLPTRLVGRAAIPLPVLGFGAGRLVDRHHRFESDEHAADIVRHAIELGVTYIDTAPMYGNGQSERRVGLALRDVARNSVFVATKVGIFPEDFDHSYRGTRQSVADSLARLGLDYLDLIQVHEIWESPDNKSGGPRYEQAAARAAHWRHRPTCATKDSCARSASPAPERLRSTGCSRSTFS